MQTLPLPLPGAKLTVAVLLIVFNRPLPTRRVLAALRQARPARLYVAADGPRPGRPQEAARCTETRNLVTEGVDWPCEVHTLFRDENLGCGLGPAAAINWFFEQEAEGIILEDDCLPTASFFPFCEEMLRCYRHDTRVMHVGGNNFSQEARQPVPAGGQSYHFSGRVHTWGWATWRRAWQHFDFDLTLLPVLRQRGFLRYLYPSAMERTYWLHKFEAVRTGPQPAHIWDYQWHFAVAAHGGTTIVPALNLVTNIGFGDDATHTFYAQDQQDHPPAAELAFPLRHPLVVLRDQGRDRRYFRQHLAGRLLAVARRFLSSSSPLQLPTTQPQPQEKQFGSTHSVPALP